MLEKEHDTLRLKHETVIKLLQNEILLSTTILLEEYNFELKTFVENNFEKGLV